MLDLKEFLTIGGALFAFLISFYALTARERKTPSVIASLYTITAVLLLSLLLRILAAVLPAVATSGRAALVYSATTLLVVATASILLGIWRLHNRTLNFRTDNLWKNLKLVRWTRNKIRRVRPQQSYEHTAEPLPEKLLDSLSTLPEIDSEELTRARKQLSSSGVGFSLCCGVIFSKYMVADDFTARLAAAVLNEGGLLQYTACGRHPVEFILGLKRHLEEKNGNNSWVSVCKKIIVVDAFTPHFGFTDSIHLKMTDWLEGELGVTSIPAGATYAGIHSGAARAFNILKKEQGSKPPRPTTLVCYEGAGSLVDLESPEQYRTFIRHVVTSERLWGGMITLILEEKPADERSVLSSYAAIFLDLDPKDRLREGGQA